MKPITDTGRAPEIKTQPLSDEQAETKPSEDNRNDTNVFDSLIPKIRKAVAREGYRKPTPIQEQCLPLLIKGQDLIGLAQTGTGKTAAFALPILQKLSLDYKQPRKGMPRALILAPTRELAAQIEDSFQKYGRFLKIRHTVIFGGVKQRSQVAALRQGVDVLIATPGRLLDLMQQGFIRLGMVEVFVLDEVDRMLDMGFIPDIKRVLAKLPENRQTLFFSATMAPRMEMLAMNMVRNPARVSIEPDKPAVSKIQQKVMFVTRQNKTDLLISLLQDTSIEKALVFTQMKHAANRLVTKLTRAGVNGIAIHGNKSQNARTAALHGFKKGKFRVLVATDVAARGLDVDDITHVFNFDMPVEAETYIHRIGRTARAGADGVAVSFCSAEERATLRAVEALLGTEVPVILDQPYHNEIAHQAQKPPPRRFGTRGGRGRRPGATPRARHRRGGR